MVDRDLRVRVKKSLANPEDIEAAEKTIARRTLKTIRSARTESRCSWTRARIALVLI
jgi:hypothetical protein